MTDGANNDWITALREHAERTSQTEAGRVIGYSNATVSQVIAGKYPGDLRRIEQAVRGAIMGATVDCPVLGVLRRDICLQHQRRDFAATNPTRVQLYHACRGECPNSSVGTITEKGEAA